LRSGVVGGGGGGRGNGVRSRNNKTGGRKGGENPWGAFKDLTLFNMKKKCLFVPETKVTNQVKHLYSIIDGLDDLMNGFGVGI